MAQCVVADSSTGVLSLSAADPCVSFVLLTPVEYSAVASSPFYLSAPDGMTLSVAIVGVWAVAVAFRALGSALNTDGEVRED